MGVEFIPLSVPNLKGNELKYVTEAVQSEWVSTAGSYVNDFEKRISEYVHSNGAVSCQNGTAGLHIAMLLANVTNSDAVIVPCLTFIAAVNPVSYVGAEPIFMDCDDSLCMDADKLRLYCETECISVDGKLLSRTSGKHIKAVVVVHVFGNLADMESIMQVAKEYKLTVIEDATEALGTYYTSGKYKGKFAGTIGNIGVYSFNGNKIITTGGGGMLVSMDSDLLARAKHLTTQAKSDEIYFRHDAIGYNYRMTNLQAALGLAQLEQLETFITLKQKNYELYAEAIAKISGLDLLPFRTDVRSNHWFYSLFIQKNYTMNRDELIKTLSENMIQTRPIWWLVNEQEMYKNAQAYKIDKAKLYWSHVVNLPCSTNLKPNDVVRVIDVLKNAKKQ